MAQQGKGNIVIDMDLMNTLASICKEHDCSRRQALDIWAQGQVRGDVAVGGGVVGPVSTYSAGVDARISEHLNYVAGVVRDMDNRIIEHLRLVDRRIDEHLNRNDATLKEHLLQVANHTKEHLKSVDSTIAEHLQMVDSVIAEHLPPAPNPGGAKGVEGVEGVDWEWEHDWLGLTARKKAIVPKSGGEGCP